MPFFFSSVVGKISGLAVEQARTEVLGIAEENGHKDIRNVTELHRWRCSREMATQCRNCHTLPCAQLRGQASGRKFPSGNHVLACTVLWGCLGLVPFLENVKV